MPLVRIETIRMMQFTKFVVECRGVIRDTLCRMDRLDDLVLTILCRRQAILSHLRSEG